MSRTTMGWAWVASLLFAASAGATTIDADSWDPARAQAEQLAAEQASAMRKTAGDPPAQWAAREAIHRRLTGFGRSPHAPAEGPTAAAMAARSAFMAEAIAGATDRARRERIPLSTAMQALLPAPPKSSALSVVLRTAGRVVDTGGYVFAYTPQGDYRGYSTIAANGSVSITATAGEAIDLYVHPQAPFAAQVVRATNIQPDGNLVLRDGVRTPVTLTSPPGAAYAGTVAIRLSFSAAGSYLFTFELRPDTAFGPTPAIYLADGHQYEASLQLEGAWVADRFAAFDSAVGSLAFQLQRGYLLELAFADPQGLTSGCSLGAMLGTTSTGLLGPTHVLGTGTVIQDASFRLTGMRIAVPRNRPFDADLSFWGCPLESWQLRGAVLRENVRLEVRLRARPQPQVSLRTTQGEPLGYSGGFFHPVDDPDATPIYFTPSYPPSGLVVGRQYDVTLSPLTEASVAVQRFTAAAGAFPLEVVVDSLSTVTARLQVASGLSLHGLLEARRDGQLVAAFEVATGSDYQMQLPAGSYVVTVTGLGGQLISGTASGVLLRPFTRSLTVVSGVSQRLDIAVPTPAGGVRFSLAGLDAPVHATALEAGRPVAGTVLYPWFDGIRTDFDVLTLRLRGPRFDDTQLSLAANAALPVVDLLAQAGNNARATGTLRDSSGAPLPNANLYVYAEDGLYASYHATDTQGRFDLPKVRNSLIAFSAPPGGNDLMAVRTVGAPGANGPGDVSLAPLAFEVVSPSGPPLQRLYGTGSSAYRVVFVAEGYTTASESFTDLDGNGVWDGVLFIDVNGDGRWQATEPVQAYGHRTRPTDAQTETNVSAANEPFLDNNGDGYPSIDDFAVFVRNASDYVRALMGVPEIASGVPFDAYLLFLPSQQAGMDVIATDDSTVLVTRDTRFGAQLMLQRDRLEVDYTAVATAVSDHLPTWDLRVVMINQPVSAGRANGFIVATGGLAGTSPNDAVAGHEFGHNPGGLADEYDEFRGTSTHWYAPALRHLTHLPDDLQSPWLAELQPRLDAPISTPMTPGIGFYAGGFYQAGGVYRPSSNSRMRYNAPAFNLPSKLRLTRQFCRTQETEARLLAALPVFRVVDDTVAVFGSGFENGMLMVQSNCR